MLRIGFCLVFLSIVAANNADLLENSPELFYATFQTDYGDSPIIIKVNRSDAPIGADRLYTLVENGFFNNTAIFRVEKGFVVQFGVSGSTELNEQWHNNNIQDEQTFRLSNVKGTVSFAQTSTPNSRSTELFINLKDNSRLDTKSGGRFAPIGVVSSGMDVIKGIVSKTRSKCVVTSTDILDNGNEYVHKNCPSMTFITGTSAMSNCDHEVEDDEEDEQNDVETDEVENTIETPTQQPKSEGHKRLLDQHKEQQVHNPNPGTRTTEEVPLSSASADPSITQLDSDSSGNSGSTAAVAVVIVGLLIAAVGGGYWYKTKYKGSATGAGAYYDHAPEQMSSLLTDDDEEEVYPFDLESDGDDSDEYETMPNPFTSDDPFGATSPQ